MKDFWSEKPNLLLDVFSKLKDDMAEGWLAKDEEAMIDDLKQSFESLSQEVDSLTSENIELQSQVQRLEEKLKHFQRKFLIPEQMTVISQSKLWNRLENAFGFIRILPEDGQYHLPTVSDMWEIINEDWTDRKEYIKDLFDCEQFSALFKAHCALHHEVNSVGQVFNYTGRHSFNVFVTQETVCVFEPQSDIFWKADENDDKGIIYKVKNEILLI